jgi:hypothetical protein
VDVKPVVFAALLGWISGDEHLPPTFVDWLTVGRAPIGESANAECRVLDQDFILRQVRLDLTPVEITKAE